MTTESAAGRGRVQRRQERTRAALIDAAQRLFAAKGIEATPVSEIAEEADIAVGSFYNYFETKEDLLAALLASALAEQLSLLQARQAKTEDPAEKISVAHRHLVRLAASDPTLAWLLVRFEVPHRIAQATLAEAAREDIEAGIEAGRFALDDPEVALQAAGGALLAIIHSVLLGELSPDCDVDHAAGVLRSLGLPAAEAAEIARRPLPPARSGGG
ncbi:MAG TPA: TetR/AcrR family transcriptional regulator [Solirubrobacterales bacterium]